MAKKYYLDIDGLRAYHTYILRALAFKANKSEIPTKTSDLTNDSGFITSSDIPSVTVPTKTSDLTNDSGFLTNANIPTKTSDLTNDSGFITSQDVHSASTQFRYITEASLLVGDYIDISVYIQNYSELMIIALIDTDALATVGVSSAQSVSGGFLCSVNVESSAQIKFLLNKTSNGAYAWSAISNEGNHSFGYSVQTGYKYFRNYSNSASSITMSAVIYGR